MSQTSITSFFNSRKRPASEDILKFKSKVPYLGRGLETSDKKIIRKIKQNKKFETNKTIPASEVTKIDVIKSDSTVVKHDSVSKNAQVPKEKNVFSTKKSASNVAKSDSAKSDLSTARKELSLGDIRKKLQASTRLTELIASADRITKGIQDLKEATEKKNLKQFISIDVEVPSSPSKRTVLQNELPSPKREAQPAETRPLISPRKVFVSPVKTPSKVPAYIRYASLATNSSLPLPHNYRHLAELFRGMETVVALLYNRNEKVTFSKLKPSVQEMLKRNFTEKHLAQIKHLVPDFYNFEVEKIKKMDTSCHKDAYELIVSPNFPNDIKIMNPSVLLERRRYFYDTLLQLVKKHHAQFLRNLDLPMIIPDAKLTRWHPEFELENVAEVDSANLPEMPNIEKFSTAQDVLAKARELFKCNTKMERALEKLAQAKMRGLTEEEKVVTGITDDKSKAAVSTTGTQTSQPSTSGVILLNPALRNLPAGLLEKVKAKQAAKALEAMTRSSYDDQKYIIYSRLPDLARTLRNIYVTERKNVLALNIILSKLDSSFKSNVSANELQRDIKILTEEIPGWIKLHEIRNTSYVKLDKNADLNNIILKLETLATKYKNN